MPDNGKTKSFLPWLPAIIYIAFIMIMAIQSVPKLPGRHTDKVSHFLAYGILSALAYRPLYRTGHANPLIGALFLSLFIGVLDETIQSFMPYRSASFADLAADGLGAFTVTVLCRRTAGRKPAGPDKG